MTEPNVAFVRRDVAHIAEDGARERPGNIGSELVLEFPERETSGGEVTARKGIVQLVLRQS